MNNKPRRPWIAALLTLLAIGLGHIYAGNPKRGFILFGIGLLLSVLYGILVPIVPAVLFVYVVGLIAFIVFCALDAILTAKRNQDKYEPAKYNRWFVYVACLAALSLISTLVSFGVKASLTQSYRIPSHTMAPTLLAGDHVLVHKFIYGLKIPLSGKKIISVSEPKRDDIVVFIYPMDRSKLFIKRVIATDGDTIEIKDKKIFINNEPYKDLFGRFIDNRILPKTIQPRDNFGPVTVPPHTLFVLGDNRDESQDSRFWGFVDIADVQGKAFMINWSWDRDEKKPRWERLGLLLK